MIKKKPRKIKPVVKKKTVNPKPKAKRNPEEFRIDVASIVETIEAEGKSNPNVYVAFCNEHFAVCIKKKLLTVNKVINKNSFQPFDKNVETYVFDTFIIQWGDKANKSQYFEKLVDMGAPVYSMVTADGLFVTLRDA